MHVQLVCHPKNPTAVHTNVASYDIAVGPAVLYSDLSSNSPLEGPRVICTAILSKTFLSESTDCRVSALSSFIFQEGCKSHIHMSDLSRTPANVELQLRHVQTDLTQLGDSLTLRSNSWKSSLSSCSVSSLTWFAFASLASFCKKTRSLSETKCGKVFYVLVLLISCHWRIHQIDQSLFRPRHAPVSHTSSSTELTSQCLHFS